MRIDFRSGVGFLILGFGLGSGAVYWWDSRRPTLAPPLPGKTKIVTIKEKVYIHEKATRYLPKAVKKSATDHVVAGTTVHRRQVTAVVNSLSGITSLYVQPRSFFSTSTRTTISAYEGIFYVPGLGPRLDTRVELTERLLRVGHLHINAQGGFDSIGAGFVGVGLSYRF
jgi:TPP-dependent 2-oxoacid decarboxylase